MADDTLLTTQDAARRLGIGPETLRYHERKGHVKATRTAGGYRLFSLRDILELARVREASRHKTELSSSTL